MADMRKLERESKTITNTFNNPGDLAPDQAKIHFTYYHCMSFTTVSLLRLLLNSSTITNTTSSADADNRLDAFSGQSRSTNIVPFHMLHIVSYCAIVTLSLRRAVFNDIRLQKMS